MMVRPCSGWLGAWVPVVGLLLVLPPGASGHGHKPAWLEAANLDGGLHVALVYPRVLRAAGPVDLKVLVRNVNGPGDVTVETIRYVDAVDASTESHRVLRTLSTQRPTYETYAEAIARFHDQAHRDDRSRVERTAEECRRLLEQLASDVLIDRYRVPADRVPSKAGSKIHMTVEIQLVDGTGRRVLRRPVEIVVQPPLPDGTEQAQRWQYNAGEGVYRPSAPYADPSAKTTEPVWYAGDQHLHTAYSLDALVLNGTQENVTDYAAAAELIGLDWIIVTDHSNVHVTWSGTEYYTPAQFAAGTDEAAAYTGQHPLLALYGQEMGAGRTGAFALPSHYLAYPFSADSTGYLANPSSGLVFGLANCEDEQVIIDRVNVAGGFGFIAHPFDSGELAFAAWNFNNGAVGWSGMEIWSDTAGQIKPTDIQALSKWHGLLNAIPAPQEGSLADRAGFPNRFPVGLGNSDAHEPGLIGATFTYAWLTGVSRMEVTDALMSGHCVASNGPLLRGALNGAQIGQVAFLLDGDNDLQLVLSTTSEFGPVGDYTLTVTVNGFPRVVLPPSADPGFSTVVELDGLNLSPPDKYVTLEADSSDGVYHAFTNPIWLQFTAPGDANADGRIDGIDLPALAACISGPVAEREPSCDIMDFDRDGDVDLADLVGFQAAFFAPGQ